MMKKKLLVLLIKAASALMPNLVFAVVIDGGDGCGGCVINCLAVPGWPGC
jgi:hypothetical protein